jgi:hypothetical protein
MSYKKLTYRGTLWQVFICLRPRTPTPPPYTLHSVDQYTYSHREGGGGGGRREKGRRETGESTDHKAGLKIPT